MNVWEEVQLALSSKGRLRILRELAKNHDNPLNKYTLEKTTNMSPAELRRQLRILVKIGWVEELPYTPKKYRVNLERTIVRRLIELFREVS